MQLFPTKCNSYEVRRFFCRAVLKEKTARFFLSEGFFVSHHCFIVGHVLEVLQNLDESVHCVVTSPPARGGRRGWRVVSFRLELRRLRSNIIFHKTL
ncbi:hypothetical protein SAMN02745218_02476 [Desulfofundulus australicus DSM 11792]|uniref:Uncharacterized protein n=1 Tax=Desulfofundulus australicus DSM 11792 TaxID=1121425 RepID=A0A1M5CBX0_9FIRM|nr:hypothetical protein SAMN02745218_02476 [Desulfofundulus australicus DSM 11792]